MEHLPVLLKAKTTRVSEPQGLSLVCPRYCECPSLWPWWHEIYYSKGRFVIWFQERWLGTSQEVSFSFLGSSPCTVGVSGDPLWKCCFLCGLILRNWNSDVCFEELNVFFPALFLKTSRQDFKVSCAAGWIWSQVDGRLCVTLYK